MDEPVSFDELVDRVSRRHPQGDALAHLAEAVGMSDRISDVGDRLVAHFVDAARKAGATWTEIGTTLEGSRRAAQKRSAPGADAVSGLDAAAHDRFSPRARAVVAASQEEARNAGHDYVGTEHIVLGLLSQPEGLAAKFLSEKTTPERVRTTVTEALGPRRDNVPEHIPYTLLGKRSIELSHQEAQRLGHDYVGTEHLLLGVLAEPRGIGAQVLVRLGVDGRGMEEWLATQ